MSVLNSHPSNAYAANGVGAVLAELGRLDEAQVCSFDRPDIFICTIKVCVALT